MLALSALSAAFSAPQTPFDAYLERPEPDFAWRDTGVNITGPLLFGGVAMGCTGLRSIDACLRGLDALSIALYAVDFSGCSGLPR